MLHGRLTMLASVLASAAVPAAAAPIFTVTPLQTLGGTTSVVNGINNAGQAVGLSSPTGGSPGHAVVWNGAVPTDLGTLDGTNSEGRAIAGNGLVAGWSSTVKGQHAFLSSGGTMLDLGTLGGVSSAAYGVNSAGQVVGGASTAAGETHAFLYSGGSMTDLGTLGGPGSIAFGINSAGTVTGFSEIGGTVHAFVHSGGAMTDLGTLGGLQSVGLAINDKGAVAGYSNTAAGQLHAFRWTAGVMEDLGTLGGTQSQANALNLHGDVVGFATATTGKGAPLLAFLHTAGSMFDLNTLLDAADPDAAGLVLRNARGINDGMTIVANGCYSVSGTCGAFRLTPIMVAATPEPAGAAVLAAGMAGLWARRRGAAGPAGGAAAGGG